MFFSTINMLTFKIKKKQPTLLIGSFYIMRVLKRIQISDLLILIYQTFITFNFTLHKY